MITWKNLCGIALNTEVKIIVAKTMYVTINSFTFAQQIFVRRFVTDICNFYEFWPFAFLRN